MSQSMIEFVVLAAIALFIGWRLYITLGQDDGPPEGRSRAPQASPLRRSSDATDQASGDVAPVRPVFTGAHAAGLETIYGADNSFDPTIFLQGARSAYEMIVAAFARGDRQALKPLLDKDVYEAWDAAISEREKTGTEGMSLLRLRRAEITDASLDDTGMARVTVEFESDLGDGVSTARSKELWTFMRQTSSNDPNWLLDDVDTADEG